ncbi:MAG: cupredoxin domain-containing protein [Longimicrobiales bacterium]
MQPRICAHRRAGPNGLVLAFVLAACGGYAPTGPQGGPLEGGGAPGESPSNGPVLIRLYDNEPSPGQVTIPAGTAVEWRNLGANSHSVSNYSTHPQEETWEDALVAPGGEFSHVFDEPGEYGFVCIFHQEVGYVNVYAPDIDSDMDADTTDMNDMSHLIP